MNEQLKIQISEESKGKKRPCREDGAKRVVNKKTIRNRWMIESGEVVINRI